MRKAPDQSLNPRAKLLWRLQGGVRTLALAGVLGALVATLEQPTTLLLAAAALLVSVYGIWSIGMAPRLNWHRWRYGLRHRELELARGIMLARRTVVPLARVQRVDSVQSLTSRAFGLSSLVISTAAGRHEIPALDETVASTLQRQVAQLAIEARETF